MIWLESVRVGLKGLAIHKIRTALSMTGIKPTVRRPWQKPPSYWQIT